MRRAHVLAASFPLLVGCADVLGLRDDYYVASEPADDLKGVVLPAGKLVHHQFSDYYAGDSQMWVVALPSGKRSEELGAAYELCSPMNGAFSQDGARLLVTAMPKDGTCPASLDRAALELFELDLEVPGSKRRLTNNEVPDEDPIYETGSERALFKHDGNIAEMLVEGDAFTSCDALAPGGFCYDTTGEQSKPVLSADGATICYFEGQQSESDVFCFERALGREGKPLTEIRRPAAAHKNVLDGRSVILGDFLYYSRWRAPNNQTLIIARKGLASLSGAEEAAAFCTDEAASYMDPAQLSPNLLVFSSDHTGLGGRDLFLGRFDGSRAAALDAWLPGSSSPREDLGASFWPPPR